MEKNITKTIFFQMSATVSDIYEHVPVLMVGASNAFDSINCEAFFQN